MGFIVFLLNCFFFFFFPPLLSYMTESNLYRTKFNIFHSLKLETPVLSLSTYILYSYFKNREKTFNNALFERHTRALHIKIRTVNYIVSNQSTVCLEKSCDFHSLPVLIIRLRNQRAPEEKDFKLEVSINLYWLFVINI